MSGSDQISSYIEALGDWRGKTIAQLRKAILAASPGLSEEWKWNSPVWSAKGNVVSAGAFKGHVKVNFFKGAALADPERLFNAGLDAKGSRAIDLYEGDSVDERAFKELVRAAVALDAGRPKAKK